MRKFNFTKSVIILEIKTIEKTVREKNQDDRHKTGYTLIWSESQIKRFRNKT